MDSPSQSGSESCYSDNEFKDSPPMTPTPQPISDSVLDLSLCSNEGGSFVVDSVPYSMVHYTSQGFHIKYVIKCSMTVSSPPSEEEPGTSPKMLPTPTPVVWYVMKRHSELQRFHKKLSELIEIHFPALRSSVMSKLFGGGNAGLPKFPSASMLSGSTNRSKRQVESRRIAHQKYLQTAFDNKQPYLTHDEVRHHIIQFLEPPRLPNPRPSTLDRSHIPPAPSDYNSAHGDGMGSEYLPIRAPPVNTVWAVPMPPPPPPGNPPPILLSLPNASCCVNSFGKVVVTMKADASTKRSLLCERFQEYVVVLKSVLTADDTLPDANDVQTRITSYRTQHVQEALAQNNKSNASPFKREHIPTRGSKEVTKKAMMPLSQPSSSVMPTRPTHLFVGADGERTGELTSRYRNVMTAMMRWNALDKSTSTNSTHLVSMDGDEAMMAPAAPCRCTPGMLCRYHENRLTRYLLSGGMQIVVQPPAPKKV